MFLFLVTALSTTLAARPPAALAADSITVSVVDEETGLPVDGMSVDLLHWADGPREWAFYDDQDTGLLTPGVVAFGGLPADRYSLRVRDKSGAYATEYWKDRVLKETAVAIVLEPGESIAKTVVIGKAGHVAGVITDSAGLPIENIIVQAVYVNPFAQGEPYRGLGFDVRSGLDGHYDIGSLAAGDYIMKFSDEDRGEFLYQFYPDGYKISQGTHFGVTPGATVPLDVRMLRAATVSGTIVTRLGGVAPFVEGDAYLRSPSGDWEMRSGDAGSGSGSYKIPLLPPGDYRISFKWFEHPDPILFYRHTFFAAEAEVLHVAEGEDVTGIDGVIWCENERPTPVVPESAVVSDADTCVVHYKVKDARPGGPTADVTIRVKTLGGKTVRTIRLSRRTVNAWHSTSFTLTLPRGRYTYGVWAIDAAGNRQTRVAHNSLVVK